ncbi:MAG: chromosome segregation protein SMC [Firmicutes bacterium HGW-Firmicutes-11]|nr:MAG: chromosome segregation protein SMC [Firmicutes bacterium HGW-Firmicutes-11]
MYFKRIDIQGFKSFAEPVSIDFHEGITCIVGPNGSGKSNISDAIRWVLGEQSPKMLRGGKMEEVIFSGTASRKSRGMAEVTLVIDNTRGILPIDYSEVAITRRMYRSGESEYSINKVTCRLRDIREMIMDTGIGVDGYSIIGQGKIADIVSNKPESRREIFEEAAGIVKYRAKKTEAERKLEGSKVNLERVSDIIGELGSRIDGLREDSEKAKEYLELRDRYKVNEVNIILKNVETIELKNEYIKDDLTEEKNRIDGQKEEKEAIDNELAENRQRSDELETLSIETGNRLMVLIEEINLLSGQNQIRKEKLLNIEKDRERLRLEIQGYREKIEKELVNAGELETTRIQMEEKKQHLREELAEKTAVLSALTKELEDRAKDVEAGKDQIYEVHSQLVVKRGEINSLQNLMESLEQRRDQLSLEMEGSAKNDLDLIHENENALKEKASIQRSLMEIEEKSLDRKALYSKNQTKEKLLQAEQKEQELFLGQMTARQKTIEEMERAYEGYNHGVRFLMKEKQKGIRGVVADLMTVPGGYETAIETALGAALQNVICDTEQDAERAIESLKQNKAGRLTFLPLSRIRPTAPQYDKQLEAQKGFLGFAASRVTFDETDRPAMEYLLGRVVLVDRLEHAIALSKRFGSGLRFVTLEGEVINAAGAMTGGAYHTNTAGLLERKAEAKRLTEAIAEAEERIGDRKSELVAMGEAIAKDRDEIELLDQSYRETERMLLSIENAILSLTGRIDGARETKQKWDRDMEHLERETEEAATMIRQLSETVTSLENSISEAEKRTEASISMLEEIKSKREAAAEETTGVRLREGAILSEQANLEQMLARVRAYITEQEDSVGLREQALNDLDQEESLLRGGDEGSLEDLQTKETQKSETEILWDRIREEKARVNRHSEELQKQKEGMDDMLFQMQTARQELEWKLGRNEAQIESYKEKLWEDFEVSYVQAMEFHNREFSMAAAQRESREIRNRMKELGEVNVGAIKEYESVSERYTFLTAQKEDLCRAMDSLLKIIEDMDRTIKKSFSETFEQVAAHFEEAFQSLFGGGTAELRLEDESRPLETGIEIVAQPPGKKLQNINLMSGGEKTMTAIALMFAVLKTKPTPFCILDEVEAALDDSNIDRFVRYLKKLEEIQFTLVTHQKATMEYADVLYGVTMPEQGISKVISLKLGDAAGS